MKKHPHAPTQTQITKLLRRHLFGRNIFCPECKSYAVLRYQMRYRCRRCGLRFSLLSHTWLRHCRLEIPTLWYLLFCFIHAVPVKQAMKFTHLSEKGVRHWYDEFRKQLFQIDAKLKGVVQVDEVYLGGWRGKAVIAGKEIQSKEVRFHICESYEPHATDVYEFFEKYITPESVICTDSSPLYPRICRMFSCFHQKEIHAKFEFQVTSEVEGCFGNLRTFIRRMYHHVTVKKLPEYLMEFQYRFSRKIYFSSVDQFLLKTLRPLTLR